MREKETNDAFIQFHSPRDRLAVLGSSPDVATSGGGGGEGCCNSVITGTILAIDRKISLSPGYVDGPVFSSKDISLSSGSVVESVPAGCGYGSEGPV